MICLSAQSAVSTRRLRIARNAVSLGGVETLACHPRTTTHSEMSEEELKEAGITDSLVRVSVGIEDWRDLLSDFTLMYLLCDAAEDVRGALERGEDPNRAARDCRVYQTYLHHTEDAQWLLGFRKGLSMQ